MGVESTNPKIPKPVLAARASLGGKDVTAESLCALSKVEMNKLASSFRTSMTPAVREQYAGLKSDQDKRQWLAQYVIDPSSAKCSGRNVHSAYAQKEQVDDESWMYEAQIAATLKDAAMAKILCESGELQERPAEHESLAKKGYKQFWFVASRHVGRSGTRQEASITAEAELKPDEYTEVRDHLVSKQSKRRLPIKPQEKDDEDSPAKKEQRLALGLRNSALRKTKQVVDKATHTMKAFEEKLPKLQEKGYPEAMTGFCSTMLQNFKPKIAACQEAYNQEVVKIPGNEAGALKSVAIELEKVAGDLDNDLKEWQKTDGNHISKLVS